ncbi:hypothetical protein [Paraburkholderia sp. J41]|uniref:hypothetical protein n=1 Tax=Paraburkholderia sp. J41 TaxID=2805433 RepID=UPI002AC325A9|nr:hypothetical protein [Paraburkholderia sp. J41]
MFDESGPGDEAPEQCRYCGARMKVPLIFCPQCGANLLAATPAFPGESIEPPPSQDGLAQRVFSALPGMAPKAGMPGDALAFDYASHDESELRRPRVPGYAWAALAAIGLAVIAYAMFHRGASAPAPGVQIIEGAVQRPPGAQASATAGALAVQHSAPPAQAVSAQRDDVALPKNSFVQRSIAVSNNAPNAGNLTTRASLARNLANARASLDRNSLWPARKSLMSALAVQPGNGEAQQLRAELAAREQQRDVLLADARQCARSQQWWCVRQSAGRAASVDVSSREAKRLLARASAQPVRASNPVRAIMNWFEAHAAAPQAATDDRARSDNSLYQH